MSINEKGTLLTVCLYLIFAAGFMVFFAPVTAGIINFGNAAGMALFTALFLLVMFRNRLLALFRENIFFRGTALFIAALFLAFIVISAVISAKMIIAAKNIPPSGNSTVIVLGCKVKGETPSLMLNKRIMAACNFLKENPEAVCIASGGQGSDEHISEAECIKRVLVENGISPERIILEDKSTSTKENIRFSKEKMTENGLDGSVTIVTDIYHQFRASLIAEKNGLETYAVSSRTSLWLLPTYWLREILAIMYGFVFG